MEFKEVSSQEDASIASYGDGGFRIGDQKTKGSIIMTPQGYYPWGIEDVSSLTVESFQRILEQKDDIDILLIGMGDKMSFLNKDLKKCFEEANIAVDAMATGAAARTYNVLLLEGRKVAAALIAIE